MSEEPDEGAAAAAAAAAADPVPEENGVADSAADDNLQEVDCSSQEDPPEPVKDDGEPPGMGGQIKVEMLRRQTTLVGSGADTYDVRVRPR